MTALRKTQVFADSLKNVHSNKINKTGKAIDRPPSLLQGCNSAESDTLMFLLPLNELTKVGDVSELLHKGPSCLLAFQPVAGTRICAFAFVEKQRELARKGSLKNGNAVASPVNQQPKKNNVMARTR